MSNLKSVAIDVETLTTLKVFAKQHGTTLSEVTSKLVNKALTECDLSDLTFEPAKPRGRKPGQKNQPKQVEVVEASEAIEDMLDNVEAVG